MSQYSNLTKNTARIKITSKCNRSCPNCCNLTNPANAIDNISTALSYPNIVLTGGEPMLLSKDLFAFITKIKESGYTGKIYLQTAFFTPEQFFDRKVFALVDGINYTLHDVFTKADIKHLLYFVRNYLCNSEQSNVLCVDSRVKDTVLTICPELHSVPEKNIKFFDWLEDCPLPDNEILYSYDILKEA